MFLEKFILNVLDRKYRDFSHADVSHFCPSEFNSVEANGLLDLCLEIQRDGYSGLVQRLGDEEFRGLLDTAAGYCVFIDQDIGSSFLGICIFAEAFMGCYASPNYLKELMRTSIYQNANEVEKNCTNVLMCLASFCTSDFKTESGQMEAVSYLTFLPEVDIPIALASQMLVWPNVHDVVSWGDLSTESSELPVRGKAKWTRNQSKKGGRI